MNNKFITKTLLTVAAVGLTMTITVGESEAANAQSKNHIVKKVNKPFKINKQLDKHDRALKATFEFQRNKTIKNHRLAQRAVNILPNYEKDKKLLQIKIDEIWKSMVEESKKKRVRR